MTLAYILEKRRDLFDTRVAANLSAVMHGKKAAERLGDRVAEGRVEAFVKGTAVFLVGEVRAKKRRPVLHVVDVKVSA